MYLAWGKKIRGLFDSDKAGKDAKKRYVENISAELEKSISTLEDVDPSWIKFTTESLFTEDEKLKIIKKIFGEGENRYNKTKFNNALQELFISKTKIELSADTIKNFEKLFEYFS